MTIPRMASAVCLVMVLVACGRGATDDDLSDTDAVLGSPEADDETVESGAAEASAPTVDTGSQIVQENTPSPEPANSSFSLEPRNPAAGTDFAAFFNPDSNRGGYFTLARWDGNEWAPPAFLLESDVNRGSPSATPIAEASETADYGVEGPGPDGLVMPEEIEHGRWRLCTANALDHGCTQIVVAEPADSNDSLSVLRDASVTDCEIDFGPGASNFLAAGHRWHLLEPESELDPGSTHTTEEPLTLSAAPLGNGPEALPTQVDFVIPEDFYPLLARAVTNASLTVVLGVTQADDLPPNWVEIIVARNDTDFAIISDCQGAIEPLLRRQLDANDLELSDYFAASTEQVESLFDL